MESKFFLQRIYRYHAAIAEDSRAGCLYKLQLLAGHGHEMVLR